jgi:uncharacterized membrane protein YesL
VCPWYNAAMIAALRVLWHALVHLYDESLLLIRANVVWFIGSVPLFLLVLAVSWLFVPPTEPDAGPLVWPLLLASFMLVALPSPFAVGVYALAADIVVGETPEFRQFWAALRRWWRHGLVMFAIGGLVLGALIFNASFYISVAQGWVQAVSILWLYAILYWITLQSYLLPLLVATDGAGSLPSERAGAEASIRQAASLPALYKRAAILALANPLFSLVLLGNTVLTMVLSAVAIPIYPLIAMAYVALVGARALRELREKYLPSEPGEAEPREAPE